MKTPKNGPSLPKVLRIDGLEIPLDFLHRSANASECERLKETPQADDIRDTDSEEGHTNAIATLLYDAIIPLLHSDSDVAYKTRLLKVLTDIKDADDTSQEGHRRIQMGLNTKAGQLLLEQFQFTPECTEFDALEGKAFFDWDTQELLLKDLELDWMFPADTTHFELEVGIVTIDFKTFKAKLHPLSYFLFIPEMEGNTFTLAPKSLVPLTGISVVIVSGRHYEMRENVLNEINTRGPVCIKVAGICVENDEG